MQFYNICNCIFLSERQPYDSFQVFTPSSHVRLNIGKIQVNTQLFTLSRAVKFEFEIKFELNAVLQKCVFRTVFPKHELQNNQLFQKFEMGSKLYGGNENAKCVFNSRFLFVHDILARATKSSELFSQTKQQVMGIFSEIQLESAKAQRGS